MAIEKHKGDSPLNARIKISYKGKKPNVTFSYPSKKDQTSGNMFVPIFVVWAFFLLILFAVSTTVAEDIELSYNKQLYNQCLLSENITLRFDCYNIYIAEEKAKAQLKEMIPFLALFLTILICSLLTYFPFKKEWSNVYPKYQALWGRKKIKKFKASDVQFTKELGYYCEIPLFSNIILNFEATKEFSKYLDEFEITEHKFKYYANKKRWMGKKDKTINEWLWYARFYFKQAPKTGSLEVLFK